MLRAVQARQLAACTWGRARQVLLARSYATEDHILLTEQEQGHILERLQDPEEVKRLLHQQQHRSHMWGMSSETMADVIVRETLEAQKADLEARMAAKDTKRKVLCEHGHEHDVCCGANKGEVEENE